MKVQVCDICYADGILTECDRYMRVKGQAELRLDYCNGCKPKVPKNFDDYKKYVKEIKEKQLDIILDGKKTGSALKLVTGG